jgi:hypothetical protein
MSKRILVGTLLLVLAPAAFAADGLPPAVTAKSPVRVWVDQIGYRPSARKIVIVAGDAQLPEVLDFAVCDAKTGKTVWQLTDHPHALQDFNEGRKDGESGEFTSHLDLSDLKAPGRYYVLLASARPPERSFQFNVADNVYQAAGLASWKAFYYNRADQEIPEKYGGLWTHKMSHRGPKQATEARVYTWTGAAHWDPVGKEVADPTPHDVSGGWWDAGNFDKYMGNTTQCHNDLLLGVLLVGDAAKDGPLNLPESGNRIPDVLDEVRYGTEWLLRMGDPTGAAWGRVYEKTTCPPEADTSPVMLTQQASGATMNRAADLAFASVVWTEKKLDPAFARKCMAESLKSWKLLEARPHPWPADAKDPKKPAPTGEWFFVDFEKMRALAAACYFRATGQPQYDQVVHEVLEKQAIPPGENAEVWPTIWVYAHTKGADPALVEKMKKRVLEAADAVVAKQTGASRGYAAGVRGYWWGSNRAIGYAGLQCVLAAELAADAEARKKYLDAAGEFVHYLYGRNPVGLCYLSNMKQFGAENSVMVMFHSWVGKDNDPQSARYIGEGPGKIGPFPGMVVGGANGGMKRYVNVLDWRQSPWEFNEPCITYQSPCASLLVYVGLKAP